jgi:hypothetical protein
MKYNHSRKFKALGMIVASAIAVTTAAPSFATYHPSVTDTTGSMTDPTGPGMTDPTGPGMTDPTGSKVTDTSGHSLDPDVKKEMHYSLNSQQTAAIRALIVGLRSDFKTAKASGNLDTFYRVTLPAAKLAYFAIVKPTDTTGPGAGHATSLTGLKDESKGRSNSLFGEKDELKGKHIDRRPW